MDHKPIGCDFTQVYINQSATTYLCLERILMRALCSYPSRQSSSFVQIITTLSGTVDESLTDIVLCFMLTKMHSIVELRTRTGYFSGEY